MTTLPPRPAQRPDARRRAYRAGATVARQRIAREAPEDARALEAVEAADLVVVRGVYDHVEQVLEALGMPFTPIPSASLERVSLRPEQLLVVNCPGQVGPGSVDRIRRFVAAGGSLFTTDWALRHVVEPAFPGTVAYNDRPTRDDVVRIEILDHDNPFLRGVMDGQDDPQWWLEGSSYPVRVLDRERVRELITSRELGDRYGEPALAVLFRHGDGEVFHMISHYYLQRTELRSARQSASAAGYFDEKGFVASTAMRREMADLSVGDVESAATSSRLFANVIAAKKRAAMDRTRGARTSPSRRAEGSVRKEL